MNRHYYIGEDLAEFAAVEHELEASGVSTPQIHVLSDNEAGIEAYHLNEVESVLKKDVVHGTEMGALVGTLAAGVVLLVAWMSGLPDTLTWVPFIFLSIVILGFCTWEGGFIGIQNTNVNFKQFQEALKKGQHVLFVDASPDQEESINNVVKAHSHLQVAGVGSATPYLVVRAQEMFSRFKKIMP